MIDSVIPGRVLRDIRKQANKVVTVEMYQNVARISADGDPDVAAIISQMFGESRRSKLDLGTIKVNELVVSGQPVIEVARARGGYRIEVSAGTKAEARARKLYVETSLRAVQAAANEGVVAGGGAALLYSTRALDRLKPSKSLKAGVEIVREAVLTPIRQLVENAQVNSRSVIENPA